MSAEGFLDVRVFLFGEDREEVRAVAVAFLEAASRSAPDGASVRGSRLYRGLPPGIWRDLHAEIDELMSKAA